MVIGHWSLVIGHWALVISKKAEAKKKSYTVTLSLFSSALFPQP
ncbi:MAG TPA: hypothetical protein PLW05_09385 [Candidatus Marinimicrobia bacterium]|nr:hypothetical protein [Candidatus Neomarinimicrobiota bacterium]